MLINKPLLRPVAVLVAMILVVAVVMVIPGWSHHSQQKTDDTSRRNEQESNQDEKNPPKDDAEATDEHQPPFESPTPPASSERIEERHRMVDTQIAGARDRRSRIRNEAVLEAMRVVPRHVFVPLDMRGHAYKDTPLPIGEGQTISQPYIVALMTDLLELSPQSKVLEIGTGSAYQAAVLAQLTPHVYTIEIIEALADRAKQVLKQEEYDEVHTRHADGYNGWEEEAPFDAIIVTCASGHLPPPLWDQLKPGGRIVIPIGGIYELQRLVVLTKQKDGSRRSRTIISVRFVPMTRVESP